MNKIGIFNLALNHLHVSRDVASENENSKEARALNRVWDEARRFALYDHDWNFATRAVRMGLLAEITETNAPAFSIAFGEAFQTHNLIIENRGFANTSLFWRYAYKWPDDCVNPREILDPHNQTPRSEQRIAWMPGSEQVKVNAKYFKVIYSNQPAAVLRYTGDEKDPTNFDPGFGMALSYLLAAMTGGKLTANQNLVQAVWNAYYGQMRRGAAHNFNQGQELPEPDPGYVAARTW